MSWSPWEELRRHPDVLVHRCRLDEGRGWWCPAERVVLIDERLDRRTARCVLAHELGHLTLGHTGCEAFGSSRWLAGRLEAQADRWAADRLVEVAALAEVLAEGPAAAADVALALAVTPDVLALRLRTLGPAERALLDARLAGVVHAA